MSTRRQHRSRRSAATRREPRVRARGAPRPLASAQGRDDTVLDLVLEEIAEGVLLLDALREGWPILHANAGFAQLTGYSVEQTLGQSLAFLVRPQSHDEIPTGTIEACRRGKRATVEIHLQRSDETTCLVRLKLCPVTDARGEVHHILAVLSDISARDSAAEALQRKSEDLQETLQSLKKAREDIVQRERMHALGKMASGIVHDFNNLLAPILGFAELMLSVPELARDPAKVESYMRKIQTAASDGAAVVSRLREFYRERNDDEQPMGFSVQDAVSETLEFTRHRWCNEAQGEGRAIDVVTGLEQTPPVSGSAPEIRQALANLIHNAVDAMPHGGTIRVSTFATGSWVGIQVADTGIGMSAEIRQRCFEPFFTTKGKAGTGLGLATVFGAVERHQGRVDIESEQGHGTTVTLWLPASRGDAAASAVACAPDPIEFPGRCSRDLRVLLVDDDRLLLEAVSDMLAEMGHAVDTCICPHDALKSFLEQSYDLVITDRAMPGMSGDQLAHAIRERNPHAPIVMLTGFGDFIRDSGEKVENVDEVVSKPLSYEALNRLLVRYSGPQFPAA